ncbi:MAG TPA: hypothetical protein VF328_26030, partial [Mycobacterium sp.]
SRDVWHRVAAVPPPPWIGTGSLDSTSNSPRDVTLAAELTRLLAHLRELAPWKKMLTLLTPTKDIAISEAAVLAKLVLS